MAGLGHQGLHMLQQAVKDADSEGLLDVDFGVGGKVTTRRPVKYSEDRQSKHRADFKKPRRGEAVG